MSKQDKYPTYKEGVDQNTNFTTTTEVLDANNKPTGEYQIKEQYRVDNIGENPVNRYSSTPETTTDSKKSATGSGLEAALGTNYSWDKQAEDRANLNYKSDVLNAKANYLTNRQTIESQGQGMQQQVDMQKYTNNQSADKVGWTGGYVLDTERQMNYLKASIQAQMYGQMELQRYGYDTALASARLAYDTNRYDLALQYYNTALSRAISEAEVTGYYVSPETQEMLNEYSIASKVLNDDTASEEDKLRADKVLSSVYSWFEDHGISKNGVETYSHIVEERTHKLSLDKVYEYQNDAQNQISTDTFVKVDADGNKIYGETDVEKINFSTMSVQELIDYIYSGRADESGNNTINQVAKDQYLSRLDSISYETENSFYDWCKKEGYIDAEGNVNSSENLDSLFGTYIGESSAMNKLSKEMQKLEGADPAKLQEILNNWECIIDFPDGTSKTLTLMVDGNGLSATDAEVKENITTTDTGMVVMKTQKNSANIIKLLNSNQYQTFYNSIVNNSLDLSSKETFALSWATFAQSIMKDNDSFGANLLRHMATVVTGPTAMETTGQIIGLVSDVINSGTYKEQIAALNAIKESINTTIGEENLALLKADYEKYNNLSDRDKALLSTGERETLEKVYAFYSKIEAIEKAIDYADDRDSDMFTDPWDYIGDSWKQSVSNWDDGYQFGDISNTVVRGAGAIVKTVGSVIVGGVKWILGIKNG